MKKAALGVIALAMSFMVTTANAAEGDIRSIFPCDMYGNPVDPGTLETAHKAGETVYFCVRLENCDSAQCYNNKVSNPWILKYSGMYDLASALILTPPSVGVYVSGRLTAANVVLPLTSPSDKPWYTDVICSYTVKPGDMAFPMTLALANGKEVGTETDAEYLFDTVPMSYSWSLVGYEHDGYDGEWGSVIATNDCVFAFGDSSVFNNGSYSAEINSWINDTDLRKAGLYVKTVEFAAEETTVPEGRTEKVNVNIEGGVNTNGVGVVYAMIRDDAPVSLAESGVSTIEFPNPSNAEMAGTYQIAAVTIPSGADVSSFSFRVAGETKSDTPATVYLATTKGFVLDGGGVNMITNFVTTTVRCVAPPPPYISVTLDGEANKSVTSGTDYADYAAKLTVKLSEAYTEDVTVEVTPSMISGSGTEPLGKYIGMSTYSENGFTESTKAVTFTADEMAGGTLSKDLYVYVLGGDDDTDGIGKGIKFAPAATGTAASYFDNENVTAILYIKKSTPQILYPTENYEYSGLAGGVNSTFTIKISDDYNNMKSPFTVEWLKTGSGSPQSFTVTPNSDGEAAVSVRYNAGEYTTRFRVQNASGVWSDYRTIKVQVNPAKQVSAVVEDPDDSGEYDETEEELTVRFKLTEGYDDSTLYAFLVPIDAASSNLVECKAFMTGVAIRSGDTESTGTAKIMLLDGSDDTLPLTYMIVLRTAKDWTSGETIGTYESKDLEIYINNVPPTVAAVNMSGSAPVTVNGGTFAGKASMGLNKIFTVDALDVEADLTNDVTAVWMFSDPNGNAITREVTGPIDEVALTNSFEVAGTYSCTVKLQDKDMSSKKYGETFSFNVVVLDTPSLEITFPNSNTFNETDADKGLSYFNIELSTAATKPLEVEIECTQVGADGVLNIATDRVTFRAGQMQQQILIDELDGTANSVSFKGGFSVTAKVITETLNEDGIAYKDVYLPATAKMYVANEPPQIILPIDPGSTNDIPINVSFFVKWKVEDVTADMADGLVVTWQTSEQGMFTFNSPEGVFTNKFTSTGNQWIQMTVEDKDGGMSEIRRLYYWVAPSKRVKVYPYGPVNNAGSDLVAGMSQYFNSAGRGSGRVWGDANSGSVNISDFIHEYSYGSTAKTAELYAWGYKKGQVDDGTLDASGKDRDIAVNSFGDIVKEPATATDFYSYADELDSFFYGWVVGVRDDEGAYATYKVRISPTMPKSRFDVQPAQYSVTLPMEQVGDNTKTNPDFPDSEVAVFFSRERYSQDNMGDMNADGIPDYYATLLWSLADGSAMSIAEAMTGVAISDGSDSEGEEAVAASDLTDVSDWNGTDMDFFPMAYSSSNPLDPVIRDWGPGLDFDAYSEIRGIGPGLNQPGVSEYDLAENEVYALFADYAAAGNALSGSYEDNYAAATNWATQTGWTPEALNPETGARLNPLKFDTDGDGFDDGWEYFFWYYAKLGAVVNGEWRRLEGRRFDPSSPTLTTRISPVEIVEAFNPHVKRDFTKMFASDFDNDGLTDFEEYVLGTNPISCDTDGDAIIELWKVMNGIGLTTELNNDGNPDRDFMARCDYAEDTFTVYTFTDGSMFALPTKTGSEPVLTEGVETSEVWKVEFADGEIGWFRDLPPFVSGTVLAESLLASDAVGYSTFSYGGTDYISAEKVFKSGSAVKSFATNTVPMTHAVLDASGFSWTDPETLEASTTAKALPLFNYGGDGVTYVPCAKDVNTYANVPVSDGVRLAAIEEAKTVTLIHHQVMCQYGFDPRVAWSCDEYGYVDQRWRKAESIEASGLGATGFATNTVPFTTRDEFLVMQYRMEMRKISDSGERSDTESLLNNGDGYLVPSDGVYSGVSFLERMTTYPNLPVSFVREWYESKNRVSPFENSTNETIVAYWTYLEKDQNIHGADTDNDGIPDGWELYVNADPTYKADGKLRDGWAKDGDDLNVLQEYAGVDSCNAYTNRFNEAGVMIYPSAETIVKNHPGKDTGWWNKFFPTNPYEADTDGDGLADHVEGRSWSGNFWVGADFYGPSTLTFIYGDDETLDKYAEDGSTVCFRGGGLNPCTVDTDGDILPDAWEYEFAGILFKDGKTDWPLEEADLFAVTSADGKQSALAANSKGHVIRGGMDGTFKGDACYDFDHDGLVNCQEYLVQSLRHLRYDDALTPLMGVDPNTKKFLRFMPFSAWDGTAFHKRCLEAGFTGLGAWQYKDLGYFVRPPHEWDMLAQNQAGLSACQNYMDSEGAGYRIMLRPSITLPFVGKVQAAGYATTDPRRIDSDYDGMDDYWEIFHGLNPLLGSYADPMGSGEYDWPNSQYDVIATIYGGMVTSWANHWTGWNTKNRPALDAIKHPWMIGVMECDADGDGLRNDEEALKVNLAKPVNTHTDPTPLWMTDSSGVASFTAQYYNPDPYVSTGYSGSLLDPFPDIFAYPWDDLTLKQRLAAPGMGGMCRDWMFAFEENEGFDTDHDFRSDSTELTRDVEVASDPQDHSDLDRRQALYFPGWDSAYNAGSAAVSYGGEFRRSPSTEPDLLKQFTVECWVKPDGAQTGVTILERACSYGPSTLTANKDVIRANFRVGIDANGCVYGLFQGSTEDSATVDVTSPNPLPVGEWSHIAFRFDGANAYLHINGEFAPVAMKNGIGFLPANGVDGIQQDADDDVVALTGYRALPCATVLGASVVAESGLEISEDTSWNDYNGYFKGWIDEVRIWDGARAAADIHADYRKRYSRDDINRLRTNEDGSGVYDMWVGGARRAGASGLVLPAELLQHYSFSTLPGGVDMGNVITEPIGFRQGVLNNVRRPNGSDLDLYTMVGWWSKTPVRSLVYWDYHIVPWIGNTVAHLPFLDGSSADSQYWSSGLAGVNRASSVYLSSFDYPNEANPYPYYFYRRDRYNRWKLLVAMETNTESASTNFTETARKSLDKKWEFEMRSGFVGTSDLVPLGLAFAKRDVDYWDGQGAMDAWTQTKSSILDSSDSDLDGIPDWASRLGFTTVESYLNALREGLLPDGSKSDDYRDIADVNANSIADWWERFYGLTDFAITDDDDHDGLSVAVEYAMGLDPTKIATDGIRHDYFRSMDDGRYLGEVMTDHDFIEDWWEDNFSVEAISRHVYDALNDSDGDGWSNWAERRAGTDPSSEATLSLVSTSSGDDNVLPGYPVPIVQLSVSYDSTDSLSAALVVKSWKGSSPNGIPDAVWNVDGSNAVTAPHKRFLGYNPNRVINVNLGPGMISQGSFAIEFFDPTYVTRVVLFDTNHNPVAENNIVHGIDTSEWTGILGFVDTPSQSNPDLGTFQGGTINYRTGDVTIDFTQWQNPDYVTGAATATEETSNHYKLDKSYVRLSWKSRLVGTGMQRQIYLSTPDVSANSLGHLREGKNTFVVFADKNGNGEWDDGEPFGMVKDVDVGWNRVLDLSVALVDDSAVKPRISVPSTSKNLVKIARTSINGETSRERVVFKREINFNGRSYLTEADIIRYGRFDLDWATLARDAAVAGIASDDITEVGYRVSIGDGVNEYGITSFTKKFPAERCAPVAVRPSVKAGAHVLSTRPEFVWTGDGKHYTAFVLEIATNAAADAVVWSSGTNLLPAVTEDGFLYRAPVFIGLELEDNATYFWRVAQLNAKWPTVESETAWSEWAEFKTTVDSSNLNTGYGRLFADVRYYGASDSDKGDVIVEAFETADFTGTPAARLRLAEGDLADLAVTNVAGFTEVCTNNIVMFDGLKPGDYYVMAFVDRNGNGRRDAFETWGYANLVGRNIASIYDPVAVAVSAVSVDVPGAVVFMEDTDINQNRKPDCGEPLSLMEAAEKSTSAWDDDEAEETWGDWAGGFDLDVLSDANFAVAGDVMAYATTNVWLMSLEDGSEFLVMDRKVHPQVGDEASEYNLRATYRYGWNTNFVFGVGSNATVSAGVRIRSVSDVEAALVHAQVYEAFGFNPETANPTFVKPDLGIYGVNTKPFTALDKYLLVRYFEQMGFCTEEDVNTNKLWEEYTLKPGNPDGNEDGIPDGWELYTMFGPDVSEDFTPLAEVSVSPFANIRGVPAAEYVRDAANTPDGGGLSILNEYAAGLTPTDPWNVASLGLDGITDAQALKYHLKTGEEQLSDYDNDGLSNWAEYLALNEGLELDVENAYSDGITLDYFRRLDDDTYIGEIVSDHDFIEDWWEDGFGVESANRYLYDAYSDADDDGWSNWSERRAFTAPDRSATLSLVRNDLSEDHLLEAYPVPSVHATVTYDSANAFDSSIVVKAWKGTSSSGKPDATWTVTGTGEASAWNSRFLGLAPNRKMKFSIGPGNIAQSHIKVEFYDPNYYIETISYETNGTIKEIVYTRHDIDTSNWGVFYFGDDPTDTANGVDTGSLTGGWVNYVNGEVEIDFSNPIYRQTDATYRVSSGKDQTVIHHYDLTRSFWRVSWMSRLVEVGNTKRFTLAKADDGYLREGKNTFVAFADKNGNGEWDDGEPFGMVNNVDVGFDSVNLNITLSEKEDMAPHFALPDGLDADERVRIVRKAINGMETRLRTVYSGFAAGRTDISKADYMTSGMFALDSKWLVRDAAAAGIDLADIREVEYGLVVGDATLSRSNILFETTVAVNFPAMRTKPMPVSPIGDGILCKANPTFTFAGDASTYSAYVIEVCDENDNVVWTSGTNFFSAAAGGEGLYECRAPIYVGTELANNATYSWRVAQLNAKWSTAARDDDSAWSAWATFKTDVDSSDANTGYGKIAAEVRYYGPDASDLANVIVGVYSSSDFTGMPVARRRLVGGRESIQSLAVTNKTESTFMDGDTNAVGVVVIDGIAPGNYYVMAFVDRNSNGRRDPYEIWGYVNRVGTQYDDIWTPEPVSVKSTKVDVPSVLVFMEDTDVNQNNQPDCGENESSLIDAIGLESGETASEAAAGKDTDGDGLSDADEVNIGTDPRSDNTDGDGMPDGWENWADTDSLSPDSDFAVDGDVMAYAETNWVVVTVDGGVRYVAIDGKKPQIGDSVTGYKLATAYQYGDAMAVGCVANIGSGVITAVSTNLPVVLIHAQVYAVYGFNTFTATPESYMSGVAVNTKPFTAFDKYMLIKYFEQFGFCDAANVDSNKLWSAYSLYSGNPDCDADGIADGWELYTMFGTSDISGVANVGSLDAAKISPFDPTDRDREAPAGDGLTLAGKWDSGHFPTDPWAKNSSGSGVSDKDSTIYHLKGDDANKDFDNDGLPNYAEYLISEVFKFASLDSDNPSVSGLLDYFGKVGKLYFGEMFTDHDFMEDHFESAWSEIGSDPAVYDAHIDSDEDGWSNWAEVRAKHYMGYAINATGAFKTNSVYDTFTYYDAYKSRLDELLADTTGEIVVRDTDFTISRYGYYNDENNWVYNYYGSGYIKYDKITPVYANTHVYSSKGHPEPNIEMTVRYNGVSGFAGKTLAVEAYTGADLNQPDAVFHVANGSDRNVNTLTFKHPASGYLREGRNTFVVSMLGATNSQSAASVPVIMGVVRDVDVGWDKVEFEVELVERSPVAPRVNISDYAMNDSVRVYLYRYSVDGLVTPPSSLNYGPVFAKDVYSPRKFLHEGDFLGKDDFDIDWVGFEREVLGNASVMAGGLPVTNVTYRAYFRPDINIDYESTSTNPIPFIEISRDFDAIRAVPEPVAPGADSTIFYGARPTFRWTNASDNYTAFAIQVKSGSTVVWNSGTQLAPPRNSRGEYEWTAPLHAGDMTARGHVFANTNSYTWSVTMYNSKFQSNSWSAERAFRVNVYDDTVPNNAGYYGLKAKVRYFGPGTFGTALKGLIRVEAYDSPDFSGVPAARSFVRDVSSVTNSDGTATVSLTGLKAGTYYVRAFLDSDGDNARSVWESWGYACPRGDIDSEAIYAPTAFTIGDGIEPSTALVYIEDTDVDQDALPDVWEYDQAGGADDFLLVKGPMENGEDGYISVNPDLMDSIKRVVSATGGNALLSYAASGSMSSSMSALMLGVNSVEPQIEESTLRITSLSLDGDTVKLSLGAEADDPLAGSVFVSNGELTATIVVRYADTLDGEWNSKKITKTFTVDDDAVSDELSFSLSELGLHASKGFFKVELKQ